MDNITINDEGLMEVSPTASRDATTAFIDQYRQLQGENTAQIGTAAHALGSDLTAQYGGLHGPSDYIKSRYQTPQTESRIANLRTTAQLAALNQLMQNEQNKWANRYNQAYRNYQKRSYDASKNSTATTSSTAGSNLPVDTNTGSDTQETDEWQPGVGDLVPSGTDTNGATTYHYTDPISGQSYILQNPSVAYDAITQQSSSLGLWPDGSKMTPGSTYTTDGKVYTYVVSNDGRGKVYQRTYSFGG